MAQEITVTGKVSSAEGDLPGVNITIEGTPTGTVTDIDGNYTIEAPNPEAVLIFSSVGYTKQYITVGNQSVIDVLMEIDVKQLEELVITGYTAQSVQNITGSISRLTPPQPSMNPTDGVILRKSGNRLSSVTPPYPNE